MQQAAQTSGNTFAVDKVRPAKRRRAVQKAHAALRERLGSIESCSDYHGDVLRDVDYQPLLAAVYTAFSEHRPLTLTPDAVWLTIAQGVAHHMAVEGERLRSRFVAHGGRLALTFECDGWVAGSPENPWTEAFTSWASQIRDHIGPAMHDALVCDFTTSGPVEVAASHVVMMDVFERYFRYVLVCVCGIPTVTLEGTPADWERLAAKVEALNDFDMEWWLAHLRPICAQFVRASRGDVDLGHWRGICKRRDEYGGDIINGWVARLFPYLRAYVDGPCTERNPIFETGKGFQTLDAPGGLSRVPFVWKDSASGRSRAMEAVAGLVGVAQDEGTGALRPKVGWAVRAADPVDALMPRVSAEHVTRPPDRGANEERAWRNVTPAELDAFYYHTDGADLFGAGDAAACRILPRGEFAALGTGAWYRFARVADGTWLAINVLHDVTAPPDQRQAKGAFGDAYHPICVVRDPKSEPGGASLVIAMSFADFLARMLDAGPLLYWTLPTFSGHGVAAAYKRPIY